MNLNANVSRRRMLHIMSIGAGAAALTACATPPAAAPAAPAAAGATASGATASGATSPTEAPAAASGAKKVIWWDIQTSEPGKTIFDTIDADFNKANPGIQIDKQTIQNDPFKTKLAAAMQAGTPPDLFQSWGGGTLSTVAAAGDAIADPLLKQVAEYANNSKYFQVYYDQYLPPATGEAVKDATQALFIGKLTPEETAKAVEVAADADLKK